MASTRSLYQVLQVDPQAEQEVVEAAYRRLARKYHPDVASVADAERRMKELNAAYEVLGDPLRRRAYDQELHEQHGVARAAPAASPAPAPREEWRTAEGASRPLLACRQHPHRGAVGTCAECGAGLCSGCFERFQPASCQACILGWARQRRGQLLAPLLWFFGALLVLGGLSLGSAGSIQPQARLSIVGGELLTTYLIASVPSGWRLVGRISDDAFLVSLILALALGPWVAPFRVGKAIVDLRRLGRLEALARLTD